MDHTPRLSFSYVLQLDGAADEVEEQFVDPSDVTADHEDPSSALISATHDNEGDSSSLPVEEPEVGSGGSPLEVITINPAADDATDDVSEEPAGDTQQQMAEIMQDVIETQGADNHSQVSDSSRCRLL